jgi:hypothetical protein
MKVNYAWKRKMAQLSLTSVLWADDGELVVDDDAAVEIIV